MSISKAWVSDPLNQKRVLGLCQTLSQREIAETLGTTPHNVLGVLKTCLTTRERRAMCSLSHSRSKMGEKNPMKGKRFEEHPNWKGVIEGKGKYLTILTPEGRIPYHRHVVKHLDQFEVHHIDGDPSNNDPDNLAIVTSGGHSMIHALQRIDPAWLRSRKLKLADITQSMTSLSKKTRAT